MNRFWHGVEEGWKVAEAWSMYRYVWQYVPVETDIMNTAALKKLLFKESVGYADERRTTSVEVPTVADKAIKHAVTHVIVVAVRFLSEPQRVFTLRSIRVASHPSHKPYQSQRHACRSMEDHATLMRGQIGGDFMVQRELEWQLLQDTGRLNWIGFILTHTASPDVDNDDFTRQELMAETFGLLVSGIIAAQITININLTNGWPQRIALVSNGGVEANEVIDTLKHD